MAMAAGMAAGMAAAITGGGDEGVIIKSRQQNYGISLSAPRVDFAGHDIPGGIRGITLYA